jgi:hypothetical protein
MFASDTMAGSIRIVFIFLFALGLAGQVSARGFKGAQPGLTTREQVIDKFGAPSREVSKGGKLSDGLVYEQDEAIAGALVVNFFFDKHKVLFRIDVYPARELNRAQVIQVYGKDFRDGTTPAGDAFIQYVQDGLTVFFERSADRARVFLFTEPKRNG